MRKLTTLVFCFLTFILIGQETIAVKVIPSRISFSFESLDRTNQFIAESDELDSDIGFFVAGIEFHELLSTFKPFYAGLSTLSAVKGNYPGLISLGVTSGCRFNLVKNSLFLDTGVYVGAGGGGGALDGGGLVVRPHLNIEKNIAGFGVKFGISSIDFPLGDLQGSQFFLGLNYNFNSYLRGNEVNVDEVVLSVNTKRINFLFSGTSYFNLTDNSILTASNLINVGASESSVGLLGAQVEYFFIPNLYGVFKINGAVIGDADGYMSILFGAGLRKNITNNDKLAIESRIVAGPSGGGFVETGGGFISQYELGLSYYLTKSLFVKSFYGKSFAPWGEFDANHIEFGIGTTFNRFNYSKNDNNSFTVNNDEIVANTINLSFFNRTYFAHANQDVKGNSYSLFNCVGFKGGKMLGNNFSVKVGTVWAYQGDYGSYAEGLLGLGFQKDLFSDRSFSYNCDVMIGAAGGGGILVGNGIVSQLSLGLRKLIKNDTTINLNFGKFNSLIGGNFNPYFADLSFNFNLNQVFLK